MDIDGSILRLAREAAGVLVIEMAERTGLSQGQISNVEGGRRRLTTKVVDAYTQVLGDTVNRRAVMTLVGAAAAGATTMNLDELTAWIRRGFEQHRDGTDWQAVVANFETEFPHLPPKLGDGLVAHLMMIQQTIDQRGGTPDLFRAASSLARLWGLWVGNAGNLPLAKLWYGTATELADRAGDRHLSAYIAATEANRGPYERYTIAATLANAQRALAIDGGPRPSTVEAHGALVHVHALTGNLEAGRTAVAAMRRAAEGIDGPVGDRMVLRALLFGTYLESRIGPRETAERAFAAADAGLQAVNPWWTEAGVYLARNRVTHGDPLGGVRQALGIVEDYRTGEGETPVRVLGLAVRDLIDAVPPAWASDPDVVELGRYASKEPGPWKTMR